MEPTASQDDDASDEKDKPKKDNKRERARKKREAREAASGKVYVKPKAKTEEEIEADTLSRLERQKVKRKAKEEIGFMAMSVDLAWCGFGFG